MNRCIRSVNPANKARLVEMGSMLAGLWGALFVFGCSGGTQDTSAAGNGVGQATFADSQGTLYEGGPVLPNVRLLAVFWGSVDPATLLMGDFYSSLVKSPYIDWLSEYNTPTQPIGRGAFDGIVQITPSISGDVTNDQIGDELAQQVNNGALPLPDSNTLFVVHLPPGVNATLERGTTTCSNICGFHSGATKTLRGQSTPFSYAVLPNVFGGCSLCAFHGTFTSLTELASHEIVEAITNPPPGMSWVPEIGDACEFDQIGDASSAPLRAPGRYSVQKIWSHVADRCIGEPAKGDFAGSDHLSDIALTGVSGWTTIPMAESHGDGAFTYVNKDLNNGSFTTWAATAGVKAVAGNFSGNGHADIALLGAPGWTMLPVAYFFGDDRSLLVRSNSTIGPFATWATTSGAQPVVGDFDGDGRDDIALTGPRGWSTLPIAFSGGIGHFSVTNNRLSNFPAWAATAGVKAVPGDFDGDGKGDIALTGPSSWGSVPVAFSNGDGTFHVTNQPLSSFPTWAATAGAQIVPGDFNGDGLSDIAITGPQGWATLPVALSRGDGNFSVTNQRLTSFPSWAATAGVKAIAGDFDLDGKGDVALTGGSNWDSLPVAFSTGAGTFRVVNQAMSSFPALAANAGAIALGGH